MKTHAQLRILIELIHRATTIIHAGDPGREGRLLINEVIAYANLQANKVRQIKRCLARMRADWLYGINMSRLYNPERTKK